MRRFGILLRKELKELLTPQVLVPFAISLLVFFFIGNVIGQQGEQALGGAKAAVLDLDGTQASEMVARTLTDSGFDVEAVDGTPEDALDVLRDNGGQFLVVVPEGFSASVAAGEPAQVETFAIMRSFSITGNIDAGMLRGALAAMNEGISDELIVEHAPDGPAPDVLKRPVNVVENVVVGDRSAQASADAVMGFVMSQTLFVPVVLFLVIVFAAQMIAGTIASEKENKTLESLLATPVSRTALVSAKMVAAGTVALATAGVYLFGIRYYLDNVTGGFGGAAESGGEEIAAKLGLVLEPTDYVLLLGALFVCILLALAAAVILGAFAENVKAAQSLLAPLMVVVMIPYFLSMFMDVRSMTPGLRLFVQAIPFSHAFQATPSLLLGDRTGVLIGIGYVCLWVIAAVFVAARIFSSDKILTMKFDLRRRRGSRSSQR